MEPMMKIINALAALTAALQEYTAQTTDGYLATFEPIYEPTEEELQEIAPKEQPAPEAKPEPVTFVQLRSRLSEISRSGHTQEIKGADRQVRCIKALRHRRKRLRCGAGRSGGIGMSGHALLAPSSSERWINCTPSAKENTGGDTGSSYAQQGTDAHALCEYKVKKALGHKVRDSTEDLEYYDEEMEVCAAALRRIIAVCLRRRICRFKIQDLKWDGHHS